MLAATQLPDRLALDVQSAQAMRAGARAGDPEALRGAAKQFEALVVQMMLKNMRQTSFAPDGDVLGDSQSLKLYREMLDQQWAQKMVAGRGLGFAEMMVKAMQSRGQALSPEEAAKLAQPGEGASAPTPAGQAGSQMSMPVRPISAARARPAPAGSGSALATAALPNGAPAVLQGTELPEPSSASGDPRRQFLDRLRPHAERVEAETGVPARFILAHAALESGWGRHEIAKADGSASHNLFGIKAGRQWPGEVAQQETTEYQYGLPIRKVEPFRAYASYAEAFRDYADLLARRYRSAVQAGEDVGGFVQGLAAGGYATDPRYAGKLQGVIERIAALGA